jgi:hypothetical protein
VAFGINIPVTAMRVSGSNPFRTGARGFFPTAGLPGIGIAIPAVVSADPDMIAAGTNGPMLPYADRRPKLDYDFRMSGYDPKGKAKQRGKYKFAHSFLL